MTASDSRLMVAGGALALLSGIAVLIPVAMGLQEGVARGPALLAVVIASAGLILGGGWSVVSGRHRSTRAVMPPGVRAAVTASAIFVAFCALELSDRLVRQNGRILYWTTILFIPALVLFVGLVLARRWAWASFRVVTVLAVVWFVGFLVVIPFAPIFRDGVPVPAFGRVYVAAVTVAFAAVFAAAFKALGRSDVRRYFGLRVAAEDAS